MGRKKGTLIVLESESLYGASVHNGLRRSRKPNRSPTQWVRFGKEEPRSTDEKMATAFAIAIFEPCGVNSDVVKVRPKGTRP